MDLPTKEIKQEIFKKDIEYEEKRKEFEYQLKLLLPSLWLDQEAPQGFLRFIPIISMIISIIMLILVIILIGKK